MGIMGIWIMMNHITWTIFFRNRGDLKSILLPSLTIYKDRRFLQLWNFTGGASYILPYHKPPQRGVVYTYIFQQDDTHLSWRKKVVDFAYIEVWYKHLIVCPVAQEICGVNIRFFAVSSLASFLCLRAPTGKSKQIRDVSIAWHLAFL